MHNQYLVRQADVLPFDKLEQEITVIGAGAIGSQVTMCLAKMGFQDLTVYDFDDVDEENINCQWFGPEDINKSKVHALMNHVNYMTGVEIKTVGNAYPSRQIKTHSGVLISSVDSMKARTEIFDYCLTNTDVGYFIDPRMSAEEGLIYFVDLGDETSIDNYKKTLYTDDEAVSEACTAKATMYCAMMLAGHVAKIVKDLAVGDKPPHTVQWNIRKDDYVSFH